MLGLTQAEISEYLGVSENTYRKKEQGKLPFKDYEMVKFHKLVKENLDRTISIASIFFENKLQ